VIWSPNVSEENTKSQIDLKNINNFVTYFLCSFIGEVFGTRNDITLHEVF